jgi:hypothetical protein
MDKKQQRSPEKMTSPSKRPRRNSKAVVAAEEEMPAANDRDAPTAGDGQADPAETREPNASTTAENGEDAAAEEDVEQDEQLQMDPDYEAFMRNQAQESTANMRCVSNWSIL